MSPRNYWDACIHRGHIGVTQRSQGLRDDDDDDDDDDGGGGGGGGGGDGS